MLNRRSGALVIGFLACAAGIALLASGPGPAFAGARQDGGEGRGDHGSCVQPIPPQARPFGKSYGDWGAEWWKWAISIPTPLNPMADPTGANAAQSQSGPVWFLAGTFCPNFPVGPGCNFATATRTCTVPVGKALFFPILNSECSTFEGNGSTLSDLTACARWGGDNASALLCEVDGVAIPNITSFRGTSGFFTWGPLPDNNIMQGFGLNAPAGTTSLAVQDGYYVMLTPPCPGSHTIHFAGSIYDPVGGGLLFGLDVTYNLQVVPAGRGHEGLTIGTASSTGSQAQPEAQKTLNALRKSWGQLKAIYR
jgi:hypothetical protein